VTENIPDTIRNSLPFLVREEEIHPGTDSLRMNFGQYEFLPTDGNRLFFDVDATVTTALQLSPTGSGGIDLPYAAWVDSMIFLLFLLCFMLFAFVFRSEGVALTGNFKNMFTPWKRAVLVRKEQVTTTEAWGEFFLILQTILFVSIFLFASLWDKGLSSLSTTEYSLIFTGIFLGISMLVGLKFLIYKTIGTFFLQDDLRNWITHYSRLLELLGILLFIPLVFYVYLHEFRNITIVVLFVLFLLSRLVIFIELLRIFVKNKVGGFYFFVYLCGTEIAPYLLCYKGVLSIISIAGNNIV